MYRTFVCTAALWMACSAHAESSIDPAWKVYAAPQQRVRLPDGRAMNLYCQGKGSPTVVLDAGLGDSAVTWRKVHASLAKLTRVCALDRAGSGFSDPGPLPRDVNHIVADMKAMFQAAALKPPYVLVGHSLGGLNVRQYANLHLEEVAGMVLVEPATEHQDKRIVKELPALAGLFDQQKAMFQACLDRLEGRGPANPELDEMCKEQPVPDLPPEVNAATAALAAKPYHLKALISELDGILGPSSDQAAAARRFYGKMPLIVLTATAPAIPGLSPADLDKLLGLLKELRDEQAALSSRGVNRMIANSGHYVQMDQPEVVIDAVTEVLAKIRAAP